MFITKEYLDNTVKQKISNNRKIVKINLKQYKFNNLLSSTNIVIINIE